MRGPQMREMRWLMKAKRWAQNPPSASRVKFVFGIIAVVLCVAAVERWVGWPDWATLEPAGRNDVLR